MSTIIKNEKLASSVQHKDTKCSNQKVFMKKKPDQRIFWSRKSNLLFKTSINQSKWKEYFPNVLETALLCQIFVYWIRDFKFWLLAYFFFCLIVQSFSKIRQRWYYRFYKGPPFNVFWFYWSTQNSNDYVLSNLSDFAQTLHSSAKLKNKQLAKIWSL